MRECVYHVVCRDCPTESLRRTAEEASAVADEHASDADHDVSVGRLE